MGDFWNGIGVGLIAGLGVAVLVAAHLTAWVMADDAPPPTAGGPGAGTADGARMEGSHG